MNKTITAALVAFAGLAASASAQVQANLNDLILGFRASGGQGQNVNLEVNLGSINQFIGVPAGTVQALSRMSPADLSGAYGINWNTRTDLVWGIVGTTGRVAGGANGQPPSTIWATAPQLTVGTQSTPWTPGSRGGQANASAGIEPLFVGAPGSLNGASPTGNSPTSALITATVAGSYTAQDTFQPGTSFGFFNPTIDNSARVAPGSYAVSDLYELRVGDTSARYLGSFGLSSQGLLIFASSPSYFASAAGAPVITAQPASQAVVAGGTATFTVAANGTGLSYQWFKDNVAIPGATSSTLTIASATAANAGNYLVRVTNSVSSITSTGFALTVTAAPIPSRIANMSVLTSLAPGENFTFAFVVGGPGTSGAKPVLMRAMGPSLAAIGVTNLLADPKMAYFNGPTQIGANDNWSGDSAIAGAVAATAAFGFTGPTSLDAAIFSPNVPAGGNSLVVSGAAGNSGAVIAELYDATPSAAFTSTTPRLVNVSILKNVGPFITLGFNLSGNTNRNVLIRAVGATLAAAPFNVAGTIADPTMTLTTLSGTPVASNDDWGTPVGPNAATAAQLSAAFAAVSAFNLPAGSKDAALLVNLAPGSYTVTVKASTGATGVALVEVYEAP